MSLQNLISAPTVGSLVKKIHRLYPELNTQELIQIIRKSVRLSVRPDDQSTLDLANEGFGAREFVDEKMAFELAKKYCKSV